MKANSSMTGGDATSVFFRTVRNKMNLTEPVQLAQPKKTIYAGIDKLMREMQLVEERHSIEKSQQDIEVEAINWNQIIAYFKGKAQGIVGDAKAENQSQHKVIVEATKLVEAKMAFFIKAYRDQQLSKLGQRKPKPKKPTRKVKLPEEESKEAGMVPDDPEKDATGDDDDGAQLILEEEQDLNIENTNKVIFELSNLISQFNEKAFEQENVSILSKFLIQVDFSNIVLYFVIQSKTTLRTLFSMCKKQMKS